jgi:sterol desaturase/sphingolipid hydroxylase (fatty acid hydroxylase superfamily)
MNGIFLVFISNKFILFYLGYFTFWYSLLKFVLLFFISLILVDFMYYIFHRLHHALPLLWVFHHVHHGDKKLNLSTAYRISIVEQIYLFLFYVPILLVGVPPYMILLSHYSLVIYQFFCHSIYIKFPNFLKILFITPQLHSIHHDQEIKHQNSNFGGVFSIWDRLFGTYVNTIDSFTPGIKGYKQDNFIMMQIDPIVAYFKKRL